MRVPFSVKPTMVKSSQMHDVSLLQRTGSLYWQAFLRHSPASEFHAQPALVCPHVCCVEVGRHSLRVHLPVSAFQRHLLSALQKRAVSYGHGFSSHVRVCALYEHSSFWLPVAQASSPSRARQPVGAHTPSFSSQLQLVSLRQPSAVVAPHVRLAHEDSVQTQSDIVPQLPSVGSLAQPACLHCFVL